MAGADGEQSNTTRKSTEPQKQDTILTSLQHDGRQENPDASCKPSQEADPSGHDPSQNSSSASPKHSSEPPPKANLVKESDRFAEVQLQKKSSRDNENSDTEWTFYPSSFGHTYHTGKKCFFEGVHLRNKTTTSERTVEMCFGKKKYVTEDASRNGIPLVTLGDHPYACPEQSIDFHKLGPTLPPVNFGSSKYIKQSDTFIPLQHLPGVPCTPFHIKEKQQELEREKMEVKRLDIWKPAPSLLQSLFTTGLTK
ncbi:spermatogenesis-associated serine-rich protein 1 isoform X1 [Podarcis raffonei]|uniref:spermatogenesis-associated serine-rich protein 1 isoform X1 n=1 Tax=Podarcis raffonei TaxID=65483 RepID=UPI0023293DEA|nr:spermatogenesis-associated serine-rich protein 1 isoform X1 [Podarcis raffonei]